MHNVLPYLFLHQQVLYPAAYIRCNAYHPSILQFLADHSKGLLFGHAAFGLLKVLLIVQKHLSQIKWQQ